MQERAARRVHLLRNLVYGRTNLRQMRAALMTVPSTGAPDRKRCRLSETDLSNARSLFAKQQRRKKKNSPDGAGACMMSYIFSRDDGVARSKYAICDPRHDGACDPRLRPRPRGNASRGGTPSTRRRLNYDTYCTATPAVWSAKEASHAASSSISALLETSPNSLRPSHVFRRYGSMRAPFR